MELYRVYTKKTDPDRPQPIFRLAFLLEKPDFPQGIYGRARIPLVAGDCENTMPLF